MGVAAFIPAKMTSRRLPAKNMRPLGGRPLIYYSIRAAQLASGIERIVVSSEDPDVLAYAVSLEAEAAMRDAALSGHRVRNLEVMRDWYAKSGWKADLVVLLQPTHPLRNPDDLSAAIREMEADPTADSLFSLVSDNRLLGTLNAGYFQPDRRPAAEGAVDAPRYRNTGSFYIFRPERTFMLGNAFGERIRGYVLSDPELAIDIDYEQDFRQAELAMGRFLEKHQGFVTEDR